MFINNVTDFFLFQLVRLDKMESDFLPIWIYSGQNVQTHHQLEMDKKQTTSYVGMDVECMNYITQSALWDSGIVNVYLGHSLGLKHLPN